MLKRVFVSTLRLILKVCPKRNVVFINNLWGQYNDSTKAIAEYISDNYKNVKMIYAVKDSKKYANFKKENLLFVKQGSFTCFFSEVTSKIVLDNNIGNRSTITKKGKVFKLIWRIIYCDNKTLNISMWHGTPLKKILLDMNNFHDPKYTLLTTTNVFCAGNKLTANIFKNFLNANVEVIETGMPRNEILKKNNQTNLVYLRLQIPKKKKVILYAPTFSSKLSQNSNQYETRIDRKLNWSLICAEMATRFGGDWIVLVREHPGIKDVSPIPIETNKIVFDGNLSEDMADYLLVCDALITDYSGSLFDILETKKICFLYLYKNAEYYNERGLYQDVSEMPFPVAYNEKQLISEIRMYDSEKEMERRGKKREEIGIPLGDALFNVSQIIMNGLEIRDKRDV